MTAEVKILVEGYTNADSVGETGEERTCATVTLVKDGNLVMVVDPGILPDRKLLLDALAREGLSPDDINMVCITHSHIDHYRNIGMFPNAKILEHFGIWHGDTVEEWQENLSEHIQVLHTPGHDYTCITLFVNTDSGVIAICGDVFWKENYPENDTYATDSKKLAESRKLVLEKANWIIPGHGKMYKSFGAVAEEIKKPENKKELGIGICAKCHRIILSKRDRCPHIPQFCYRCCECDIECDLCSCKRRQK